MSKVKKTKILPKKQKINTRMDTATLTLPN